MNIEKFVNSKFYRGFEWFYRLIFINLFTLIVSFSLAAIPFLVWYNAQELVWLIYVSILFFILLFVPAYISAMLTIKYYIDENTGNLFIVYFKYLIDTIKEIYLVELILVPIFALTLYGAVHYWQLLGPEYYQPDMFGIFSIVAFVVEFFLLVLFFFMFVNLSYIVTHFKMKTSGYIILSFKFSLRYMFQSLLALLALIIPIVLIFILGMPYIPIYFVCGISFPQFILYKSVRNKFNYLQRNLDEINK